MKTTQFALVLIIGLVLSCTSWAEDFVLGDFKLKPPKGLELNYQVFPGQTEQVLVAWKDYSLGFYLSAEPIARVESAEAFWQNHKIFNAADEGLDIEVVESGELKVAGNLNSEYRRVNVNHNGNKTNQIIYLFLNEKHAFSVTITFLDKDSGDKVVKETNRLFKKSKLLKPEQVAKK